MPFWEAFEKGGVGFGDFYCVGIWDVEQGGEEQKSTVYI